MIHLSRIRPINAMTYQEDNRPKLLSATVSAIVSGNPVILEAIRAENVAMHCGNVQAGQSRIRVEILGVFAA